MQKRKKKRKEPCRTQKRRADSGIPMQADYTYQQIDTSYNELAKELHNGRLFRLLTKLNMIVERPQPGTPAADSWSETGDR